MKDIYNFTWDFHVTNQFNAFKKLIKADFFCWFLFMLLLVLLSLKSLLWQCIQWNSFLNWENLKRMWEAEKHYFHCVRVQWITGIMRLQWSHMHTSLEAVCGSRHKNQSFPAVFLLSQTWRPSHSVLTNVFWPQPWHTHTHNPSLCGERHYGYIGSVKFLSCLFAL